MTGIPLGYRLFCLHYRKANTMSLYEKEEKLYRWQQKKHYCNNQKCNTII